MAALHDFWAHQPPGAAPPGPLCHLFPRLQLLWNGAAHTADVLGGVVGNVGTPINLSVSRDTAGTGISLGSSTGSFISFAGKASGAQTKVTFFGVFRPDLTGQTQILLLSSATTTGHQIKIDTSNNLTLSKPGVADYASISLTDKEAVAFIASHDEATDAYWIMVRSLHSGIIRSTSGTSSTTAGSCDGSVCVAGRTDGASSCSSPLTMGGISFDYLPQALGYAFLDTPWHVFARDSSRRAAAGNTYNVSLTESATATDAVSMLATLAAAITETASATDSASAIGSFGHTVTEAASATDAVTATATLLATLSEAASATDAASAIATLGATVSESVSAADVGAAALTAVAAVSEAASATDSASWSGTAYSVDLTETTSAADAIAAAAQVVAQVAEAVTAGDAIATAASLVGLITAPGTATDSITAGGSTYSVTLAELAAALDVVAGVLAGGTTVRAAISAARLRLDSGGAGRPRALPSGRRPT